jgi:uncharacterized protein
MKFTLEQTGGTYSLHSYSDGTIVIRPPNTAAEDDENLLRLQRSCLLSPGQLIDDWPPQQLAELTTEHLQALKELKAEVLLLGSGNTMRFPSAEQLSALVKLGIGYEIMDTAAACRTYNVLLSEGRKVAAALFPR